MAGGPWLNGRLPFILFWLALAALPSCVSRTRVITRQGGQPGQPLLEARKEDLLQRITNDYEAVKALSLTVDMTPSLGSSAQGKLTEYQDVRGYLLYRRPSELRLIGLYPLFRAKAFDMTTDGNRFRLYVPSKNRFLEGRDAPSPPSPRKLENLRPHHFLQVLVVRPPVATEESPMLYNFTDERHAFYVMDFVNSRSPELRLRRQIWFDRISLHITRQMVFDEKGEILTDARYDEWQREGGVEFPRQIDIQRPKDQYGLLLRVTKLQINPTLSDDQFRLERPEGTELLKLGAELEGNLPQ